MKGKKINILLIASLVGVTSCVSLLMIRNNKVIINNAAANDYSLTLNSTKKFTSEADYSSGNAIVKTDQNQSDYEFSYKNLKNYDDGFDTFKSFGYIQNVTPLKGLYSITISASSSLTIYYGSEPINDTNYFASVSVDGSSTYSFENNLPQYIRIFNPSSIDLDFSSIVFHYTCQVETSDYEIKYHLNGGSLEEITSSQKNEFTVNYLNSGYSTNYATDIFIYKAGENVNQLYAHKVGIIHHNLTNEYVVNQIKPSGETAYNNLDSDYWIVVHGNYTAGYNSIVNNESTLLKLNDIIRVDKSLSDAISSTANITVTTYDGSAEYVAKTYSSPIALPNVIKDDETFSGWYTASSLTGKPVSSVNNSMDLYAGYGEVDNSGLAVSYLYTNVSSTSDNVIEKSDILNVAFGSVSATGTISNASTIGSTARSIKEKATTYGNKVLVSLNGATNLSTVAASESLRETLADNIVSLINTYNLDGIDIDWEFPSTAEKANFTSLVKIINEKVKANNSEHLLTAAMGIDTYTRFDLSNSAQYIDYINVMTYDMHASTAYAQHHSALYKYNAYTSIDTAMKYYITNSSIDPSKLVLGIPYYGYKHTGVTSIGSSCTTGSAITYSSIASTYLTDTNYEQRWDDDAKVPYLYNSSEGIMISYDNEQSIALKGEYAKAKGLAGMFSWQDGQDSGDTLANAMFAALEDWKQEEPSDSYDYRETAVTYMNALASVKWTPTTTITYYDNNSNRQFVAGTTYTGLPYTQGNGRTTILSDPLNLFKEKLDSAGNYNGPTGYNSYYGSDCSSSVYGSWNAAGSGITSATYTLMMLPSQNSEIKAVGDYTYSSESTSADIQANCTQDEMYECYKKVLPGDAFVKRTSSSGHIRMVTSIDIANKLVYFTEQYGWGAGTNTTWKQNVAYSFDTLYSDGYIPISNAHLLLDTIYSN